MSALVVLSVMALALWSYAGYLLLKRRATPFDTWRRVLEPVDRDAWQVPGSVVALCALSPNSIVADVGAGTGYFTTKLAREVPRGQVIAVEKEEDIARGLAVRVQAEGLANVTVLESALDLPTSVDCVLMVNTWRFLDAPLLYAFSLAAQVRSGGRVVVVDFAQGSWPVGPPDEKKAPKALVNEALARAGFTLIAEATLPYQYALIFTRP